MRIRNLPCLLVFCIPCVAGTLQLNSLALDTSLFRVTEFANVPGPLAMVSLSDGSIGIGSYANGIVRYSDSDHNGVADGTGTRIYATTGAQLGLVRAGNYYLDSNYGPYFSTGAAPSITILQPGVTADAPLTPVASLQFGFPPGWEHNTPGIATRPTPGRAGSYDLVFNVGSQFDHESSTGSVQLSGLISGTLDGDSLYAVTIDLSGQQPSATSLHRVGSGIRNVIGMGFQPGTGDFYFLDNAIDGPGADGDEPPQAEEINRIAAADFGSGTPPDFGYPNCYIQYRTGAQVGSGCVQPFFAIQPIANGTALGSESEGVSLFGFAPANFPSGFNNGIFIGFAGKPYLTGAANEENAVGYFDFTTGNYLHFSENSQDAVYQPIGILSTADSLFIADYGAGKVYEVTGAAPEPAPALLCGIGSALVWLRRRGMRPQNR